MAYHFRQPQRQNHHQHRIDNEELEISVDEHIQESLPSSSTQIEINLQESGIETLPEYYLLMEAPETVHNIALGGNRIMQLPSEISIFSNLNSLSLCGNVLTNLPEQLGNLKQLRYLDVRNNLLETLPKSFAQLNRLQSINLSGNHFTQIPAIIFELSTIRALYLGANRIQQIPNAIGSLISLNILYLGGNRLREIPATIGRLLNLTALSLCDNQLESIPTTIADLQALSTLALHSNLLTTLPIEIVRLRNLEHLSLRNNPLVNQFVRDMSFDASSLKELSARIVKMKIPQQIYRLILPYTLNEYISNASQCVNPKCKGVYFDACIEHIKFVDFCGKYRVPLLQYLCSPRCSSVSPAYAHSESSDSEGINDEWPSTSSDYKLRKIMLG